MTVSPTETLVPGLDELERPLNDRERRRWLLRPVVSGTPFDDSDRLFPSFESTGVYDQGQEDAAQIKQMLRRDGRVRQLENVLTLPDRACIPEFRERKGSGAQGRKAVELCQDALGKHLKKVQPQATSSRIFRKAFFEIEWTTDGGNVVPRDIAWRPPATCQARFDPRSGKPAGFRQQVVTPDGKLLVAAGDELPGWKLIPQPRALIFTHGTHREPITGTSELDVAYWCWESRQKVLYLLFQFLESQSLPKIVAYGASAQQAQANADWMAGAVSSSVIPMVKQPGQQGAGGDKLWDIIESSGKGAGQFLDAVRYLEEQQVQSVLAGFLQLTELDKSGGSFALGQDARQFFLQSRQADADEIGDQIVSELADPLCSYNLGATDLVDCKIGPLSQTETGRALEMLKTLATASTMNVPGEFVDDLTTSTAKHLGLDPDKVAEYVEEHAKQRAEREAQMAEVAAAGGPAGEGPGGTSPPSGTSPRDPAAKQRKAVGQNIDSAFELVRRVDLGQDPHDALRSMTEDRIRARGPNPGGALDLARDEPPADAVHDANGDVGTPQ